MAPKGGNAKKESGRAKKAENEANKRAAAAAEAVSGTDDIQVTSIDPVKKADAEAKRQADLARKAEKAKLLAEEEASAPSKPKAAPKAGAKKAAPKPAGPGAIAAGGGLGVAEPKAKEEPEVLAATGIDNAIDLLEVVTAKMDKASVGSQAAKIEQHPERRFKAAFEAYKERELPVLRSEQPGLRLQQYQDLLYKRFQKSPENPFNQVTVSYDASKDDKVAALKKKQDEVTSRLRL
ncbi:DUF1014-domain-containing protein [Punctularia strigosozonata HHB-11173 SS5]|uniref:DUF1014-domain-containing protein n=1 Tax=Punctularia strigosozonata (strain HHB-11173) TaxID=741275 RepID=UPI0004416669|nr:DUF1014-domain-containing protein [Punctularia strigosozonata HHB-11173 SS5]EIN07951.1 DUF1014-domain-containing protein [Punctularia strigosozonata HHB-11173 SS5]